MGYNTPEDIANRALQHCGVPPSNRIASLTDNTKNAKECALVYNKVRQAVLRENTWEFAIRRSRIRPVDTNTLIYTPPTYDATATYGVGDIVAYVDPVDNSTGYWLSEQPANINNTPGALSGAYGTAPWCQYWGPIAAQLYSSGTSYSSGELVYKTPGDGTYTMFLSLQSANTDDPATVQDYDATVTYKKNDIVVSASINYISLIDLNTGNTPAGSPSDWATTGLSTSRLWRSLSGTLSELNIIYPIGAGPSTQSATRNIFRLPWGFLRIAAQDPKAGSTSPLGAPSNLVDTDWLYESDYIISRQVDPIDLRYSGDWSDVKRMDALFCEALAAKVAYEICESITQSSDKLKILTGLYQQVVSSAKKENGILVGVEYPPLDDYLACRA
jgi:hypothetical protein